MKITLVTLSEIDSNLLQHLMYYTYEKKFHVKLIPMTFVQVQTDIITSITVGPSEGNVILVLIHVKIFKTDLSLFYQ